ncbi:MAG: hypothetical protein P8171_14185 [Candidatus Thiodiazotropha sp.]|jgi:hypothetical protein
MIHTKSLYWVILGVLVLAIFAVTLFKAWPILFPDVAVSAQVDPQCDLRSAPCTSQLPDGSRVTFSIQPRTIPVLKPLQFEVRIEGLDADRVEVDFAGTDMNMGFNRVTLDPAAQPGTYTHGGMLPVCVRDVMEWEARVLISTQQGMISVPYRFVTVRPGIPVPTQ